MKWKHMGEAWYGYGNGYKVVVYEFPFTDSVQIHVHKGSDYVEEHISTNLQAAKRWAERVYLRGKK